MLLRLCKSSFRQFRSVSVGEWLILTSIIGLGIASRLYLESAWNFKPVAALILYGGFILRHWLLSAVGMLAIMWFSDLQLGLYDWRIMATTYGALVISACLGGWIRRRHGIETSWSWFVRFMGAAVTMSVLFHLLTNTAVWWVWYPRSWQGFLDCFVAAMPFFRSTLESNLLFTGLLTGSHAIVILASTSEPSLDAAAGN
jgi:hypothetical protein